MLLVDILTLIFDGIVAIIVVIALRYLESLLHFRLGPSFVSGRERELEAEILSLRQKVGFLEEQYKGAVERELEAHRNIATLSEQVKRLQTQLDQLQRSDRTTNWLPRRRLLVALGSDPNLQIDLAALRAVRTRSGVEFHRITGATSANFAAYLDRQRANGHPVELVHIGVHADGSGLRFADGVVTWDWLSGALDGVKVLLLAGCDSTNVGDWLGVVPHVVTVSESITHEDAAKFAQAFWMEIGNGVQPDQALERAFERSPAQLQEFVIGHW